MPLPSLYPCRVTCKSIYICIRLAYPYCIVPPSYFSFAGKEASKKSLRAEKSCGSAELYFYFWVLDWMTKMRKINEQKMKEAELYDWQICHSGLGRHHHEGVVQVCITAMLPYGASIHSYFFLCSYAWVWRREAAAMSKLHLDQTKMQSLASAPHDKHPANYRSGVQEMKSLIFVTLSG